MYDNIKYYSPNKIRYLSLILEQEQRSSCNVKYDYYGGLYFVCGVNSEAIQMNDMKKKKN